MKELSVEKSIGNSSAKEADQKLLKFIHTAVFLISIFVRVAIKSKRR